MLFHEFVFYLPCYPLWMARIFKSEFVIQLQLSSKSTVIISPNYNLGGGGGGLMVSDLARLITLTLPLSTSVYKLVPVNLMMSGTFMLLKQG